MLQSVSWPHSPAILAGCVGTLIQRDSALVAQPTQVATATRCREMGRLCCQPTQDGSAILCSEQGTAQGKNILDDLACQQKGDLRACLPRFFYWARSFRCHLRRIPISPILRDGMTASFSTPVLSPRRF